MSTEAAEHLAPFVRSDGVCPCMPHLYWPRGGIDDYGRPPRPDAWTLTDAERDDPASAGLWFDVDTFLWSGTVEMTAELAARFCNELAPARCAAIAAQLESAYANEPGTMAGQPRLSKHAPLFKAVDEELARYAAPDAWRAFLLVPLGQVMDRVIFAHHAETIGHDWRCTVPPPVALDAGGSSLYRIVPRVHFVDFCDQMMSSIRREM